MFLADIIKKDGYFNLTFMYYIKQFFRIKKRQEKFPGFCDNFLKNKTGEVLFFFTLCGMGCIFNFGENQVAELPDQ